MAVACGAPVSSALHAAEGVPLFVEELLDAAVGVTVPRSMYESVRRRVAELDAGAGRVLAGAALLCRRFDCQLRTAALGYDEHAAGAPLRAAAALGRRRDWSTA